MKAIIRNTYNRTSALHSIAAAMVWALLSAGCSSSVDTPDNPDTPGDREYSISFGTSGGAEEVTRAGTSVGLETLGIKQILVYGYKTLNGNIQNVMPGYTLNYIENSANTTTSNTSDWEYVGQGTDYMGKEQEIKYWDGNSTDYRFFAVLPTYKDNLRYDGAAVNASTEMSTTGNFSMTFTGLEYMTHTSDGKYYDRKGEEVEEKNIPMYGTLWQGDPATYYKTPVSLSFVKPYASVRLVFIRPEGTSTTVLGKDGVTESYITFGPKDGSTLTGNGEVNVNWAMNGSRETATATAGTVTLPTMTLNPLKLENQETRYQAWPEYLMIPTSTTGDFLCTVKIYTVNSEGTDVFDKRTAVIPAAYMQWKPGYQYTYVFKITQNNSLEFSHAVEVYTKWQAGYTDKTKW